MTALDQFHPAVCKWFAKRFPAPTEPQARAWPAIKERRHTLIAAPTGSGKTLAAFLSAIDDLVWQAVDGKLRDETQVVYISPLKALSNDIQINLQEPLRGVREELEAMRIPGVEIRTLVRTGDTPTKERVAMSRRPPHIVVTTPESLYILLTSEGGRKILSTTRTVLVDEIHALVRDKRGSHLALSIERLQELVREPLIRIGLSATQKPIDEVARFLVGTANLERDGRPRCAIIDSGHARQLDLAIEVTSAPLGAVMSNEVWEEVYDRVASLIREHRTTLVFVNTRRMAERVARHLGERLGDENVTAHHGSLARELRLAAEQRLKSGELSALVATASLELGIDIGAVDLVVQIGSTRAIATLLQRVGRSGHTIGGFPKGRIFPLSRDELVECVALIDSVRRGELDRLIIPEQALDILAQQIVASVSSCEWQEDALFEMVRRAYPYRNLARKDFDAAVRMLAEGFATRRGRRGAYLHHDAVNQRLRGRRGARLRAITNGGAIPDTADYRVILEPAETFVGTLNEDFAIESLAGDIFQLGNAAYRIKRIEPGAVRVEDASGQSPNIPFWLGEAPGRTWELSEAVSRLRTEISDRLDSSGGDIQTTVKWLTVDQGVNHGAAEQMVEYLAASKAALGVMPTQKDIVVERFFDENGSTHVVIHAPFGSRLNRAWGLALRKRFCRKFNFELQAAATEDSIVLSLGPTHSFPLETIFSYLNSKTVREVLTQALLDAPMFNIRWRWNATRALAIPRWRSGHKVAPQLQRMAAEDLLALVFPDQLACAENLSGLIEIPDHPLVSQTIHDCLQEAMDIERLESLLRSIERGERNMIAWELTQPSPLAQEVLSAKPYAFLDDAPAEERRTLAVMNRRWLDAETAADLGKLDLAAIERVRQEAWPQAETADELHDALVQLGFMTVAEAEGYPQELFDELVRDQRAAILRPGADPPATAGVAFWVAAERLAQLQAIFSSPSLDPAIEPPSSLANETWAFEDALAEILRGRLEGLGPTTAAELAASLGIEADAIREALVRLEAEGFAMQGRFTADGEDEGVGGRGLGVGISIADRALQTADSKTRHPDPQSTFLNPKLEALPTSNPQPPTPLPLALGALPEWCSRRLLARIHSYTLNRLRREIEPVSAADFMRFLFVWQKVAPDHHLEGPDSLASIVDQLEGFEAPAGAWESEILPARLEGYDPTWLDALCLSRRLTWLRIRPPRSAPEKAGGSGPVRSTPIVLLNRKNVSTWANVFPDLPESNGAKLSTNTQTVYEYLKRHGASFFVDMVAGTSLLPSMVEEALAELVFRGLVSADSFTGLRALLLPLSKATRKEIERRGRRQAHDYSMENAGRWVQVRRKSVGEASGGDGANLASTSVIAAVDRETTESVARNLLRRYGVVFRRVLEREAIALPWRDLLRIYRRLEARGEIRGGRFVGGFSGEQFALPEAVQLLRSIRRAPADGTLVSISAADPLNLVGLITPGTRPLSATVNRILYRDGVPIAILESREIRFLAEMSSSEQWKARNALLRRSAPPKVRSYLRQ